MHTSTANGNKWFEGFKTRKVEEFGSRFDASDLDIRFFQDIAGAPNARVKVQFPHGEIVWGFVSVTTGWKPTFILLRRIGQVGSSDALGPDCQILDRKRKTYR
jgi:hypothetical protein